MKNVQVATQYPHTASPHNIPDRESSPNLPGALFLMQQWCWLPQALHFGNATNGHPRLWALKYRLEPPWSAALHRNSTKFTWYKSEPSLEGKRSVKFLLPKTARCKVIGTGGANSFQWGKRCWIQSNLNNSHYTILNFMPFFFFEAQNCLDWIIGELLN